MTDGACSACMRSTGHPPGSISSRSWALQQYDEAKKGPAVAAATSAACKPRAAAAAATQQAKAAGRKGDDDWDLCGWQDEPSVSPAARAASLKLVQHQAALSPVQLPSPQHASPAGAKQVSSGGGSSRRTTAVAGAASSPSRRLTKGTAATQLGSRPAGKQQQHPANRRLQLGEEDSYGAAAEHYRPAAAAAAAFSAGDGPVACSSNGCSTSGSCHQQATVTTPRGGNAKASSISCHLPSLQQQQPACRTCLNEAAAAGAEEHSGSGQSADADDPGEGLAGPLYAPRGGSRGAADVLLPSATSRRLLPSTSSGSSSSSRSVANSNILALQQRLLLPQPGAGHGMFGGSEREGGSGRSPLLTGQAAVATGPSAGLQQAAQLRGPRMTGQQAASVPGASLHARMASTAARAQLLLCRELTSLTPPLAPRTRPAAAAVCNDTGAPAVDGASSQLQAAAGASMLQQQLLQPGDLAGGSSLRFVTISRPSSAAKGKCSSSGVVVAGAPSSLVALQVAAAVLDSPGSILPGSTATSTSSSGAGDSTAVGCAFSRRPLSAGVAVRWGSSSGSSEGGSSGRPSTSGSVSIPGSGAGPRLCQSKGLSAAAEYNACRATVGELLQRINSQKAAGVGQSTCPPAAAASSTAGAGVTTTTQAAVARDTVFCRDGRLPAGQAVRLAPASSLAAYQAFQSGYSVGDSGSGGGSSSTVGSSRPCMMKSISSGPRMSVSGLNVSTAALELRANAALRKCGSNKQ